MSDDTTVVSALTFATATSAATTTTNNSSNTEETEQSENSIKDWFRELGHEYPEWSLEIGMREDFVRSMSRKFDADEGIVRALMSYETLIVDEMEKVVSDKFPDELNYLNMIRDGNFYRRFLHGRLLESPYSPMMEFEIQEQFLKYPGGGNWENGSVKR